TQGRRRRGRSPLRPWQACEGVNISACVLRAVTDSEPLLSAFLLVDLRLVRGLSLAKTRRGIRDRLLVLLGLFLLLAVGLGVLLRDLGLPPGALLVQPVLALFLFELPTPFERLFLGGLLVGGRLLL